LLWLALLVVLWRAKPEQARLADGLRLLPDVIRMLRRLAADPELPRGVGVRLGLLMAYLLSPIDLIPDSSQYWATPTTQSSSRSFCAPSPTEPGRMPSDNTGPGPEKGSKQSYGSRVCPQPVSARQPFHNCRIAGHELWGVAEAHSWESRNGSFRTGLGACRKATNPAQVGPLS
jgi:hypothetical protein